MKNYDSGFLIVRSYEWMYQHFWKPAEADQFIYAIPRKGADPKSNEKKYHGISRNPLEAWYAEYYDVPPVKTPEELTARSALRLLEDHHLADEGFIFQESDARDIFARLIEPTHWELIWATKVDTPSTEPVNTKLLGFEPTWFYSDFFSAIADSMCFPMWHGPDPEGTLFLKSPLLEFCLNEELVPLSPAVQHGVQLTVGGPRVFLPFSWL